MNLKLLVFVISLKLLEPPFLGKIQGAVTKTSNVAKLTHLLCLISSSWRCIQDELWYYF